MIGRTLSHFKVTAELGAGGMGKVYRAEDSKLGREVAIKVLPAELAADPERMARFAREAKVLASLNHPNIAAIYSFESSAFQPPAASHQLPAGAEEAASREGGGPRPQDPTTSGPPVHFLVMELVEGKTLDAVIAPEGMTLDDFFELAVPLAEALAVAHEKGITHRDLKPANIMVSRDGRVKILDFGVAKLRSEATARLSDEVVTEELTTAGRIIGTVPYMSPEQIKGDPLDGRSDLFSLGVLLYQMTTCRYPFTGAKSAEILASILKDRPPLANELRAELPRQLGRIISHCLEKDPKRRFQTATDLRNALADLEKDVELGEAPSDTAVATTPEVVQAPATEKSSRRSEGLIAIALIVIFGILFAWQRFRDRPQGEESQVGQTAGESAGPGLTARRLSQLTFGEELEEWPAFSPDGSGVVYSAEVDGFMNLFLRTLVDGETQRLTRSDRDDIQSTWSPNAQTIVFVRSSAAGARLEPGDVLGWYLLGGDLWRLDPASGQQEKIVEDAFNPAFSPDGARIAMDADWAGPHRIWSTDSRGRNPKQLTTDTSEAVTHTHPSWSPDGSQIAFRKISNTISDIAVLDLATGSVVQVTDDEYVDMNPAWSPDGNHVYFSSYRGGGLNIWRIPVTVTGEAAGPAEQLTTGAGTDLQVTLSPDGKQVAFSVLRLNSDLWSLPVDAVTGLASGPPEPVVSTTREDSRGSWSPDSTRLAFNSDREGTMNIWLLSLAEDDTQRVTQGAGGDYQPRFSPDGATLVFFSARSGNNDIWKVDIDTGELTQLTRHPGLDVNPFFSPDGRWIAYQSDADGRLEVWLMNSDASELQALTSVGTSGHFLLWSDDSSSLLFRSGVGSEAKMYSVEVSNRQLTEHPSVFSGAHMSYSPNRDLILDVAGHKTLWLYPVNGDERRLAFEFSDPAIRIDYPTWSPDGTRVIFDRADPQGGDVWLLEGL